MMASLKKPQYRVKNKHMDKNLNVRVLKPLIFKFNTILRLGSVKYLCLLLCLNGRKPLERIWELDFTKSKMFATHSTEVHEVFKVVVVWQITDGQSKNFVLNQILFP